MDMRPSRVLRQMRAGIVATCVKMNTCDPRVAEIAALCGFDCVWIDLEHIPNSYDLVERVVWAAKSHDCDVLTRVSKGCYSDMIRPLEADSTGIMVPHLMSLEEALKIQYFTKYHPVGRRPLDGGNADGSYCMIDTQKYISQANDQRFTVVQIEDPEPIDELDEICSLPGLDMIFFGPGDFSQGIGTPGNMSNPVIAETRKKVAECARKHNKFAGTVGSVDNFDLLVKEGYSFISVGADVVGLSGYFRNICNHISDRKII
jgi:4-hydroxy-2-oxoheptanedioate aldolase